MCPAGAAEGAGEPTDETWVEIVCNGTVVDPEMSLATVRDFIWKKPSAELLLCYRRAERSLPNTPPPLLQPLSGNGMPVAGAGIASSNIGGTLAGNVDERVVDGAGHAEAAAAQLEGLRGSSNAQKE